MYPFGSTDCPAEAAREKPLTGLRQCQSLVLRVVVHTLGQFW